MSKYFVSDIVLGFGGAAESLTQSISRISRYVLKKVLFSANEYFSRLQPQNPTLPAIKRGTSYLSPGSKFLENDLLVLILQHET